MSWLAGLSGDNDVYVKSEANVVKGWLRYGQSEEINMIRIKENLKNMNMLYGEIIKI